MTTPSNAANRPTAAEPTHACVRCGAPVPLDVSMCENCNPLGLEQPATSQAHGTVLIGIVLAVLFLAVAGRLALQGVGPFEATVSSVTPADRGLAITLMVTNEGTSAGTTRCRVAEAGPPKPGPVAFVVSPHLDAGQTATFTAHVTEFGATPRELAATCDSP
jgi:hypothetical protein